MREINNTIYELLDIEQTDAIFDVTQVITDEVVKMTEGGGANENATEGISQVLDVKSIQLESEKKQVEQQKKRVVVKKATRASGKRVTAKRATKKVVGKKKKQVKDSGNDKKIVLVALALVLGFLIFYFL